MNCGFIFIVFNNGSYGSGGRGGSNCGGGGGNRVVSRLISFSEVTLLVSYSSGINVVYR